MIRVNVPAEGRRRGMFDEKPILEVKHLSKLYGIGCDYCLDHPENRERNYCPRCRTIHAVSDVSFELYEGEILGIVGESGSGKSTLVQCMYFDQDSSSGDMVMHIGENSGKNVFTLSSQKKNSIRNQLFGMVYQNPYRGLKMKFSAYANVSEKLIAAGSRHVQRMLARSDELLDIVHIEAFRRKDTPKHFSGGMQQRVQIAKALSNNPPVLLLDEVTTGLDLSVQANVLDLIKIIQHELKVSMIVVSHDLAVVRMLAERTLVMLDGRVVEAGLTDQILEDPTHQYTQQLVYSLI